MGVWNKAWKIIKPKQKTTGTETVNPFKFTPSKTEGEKYLKKFKIDIKKDSGKFKKSWGKTVEKIDEFENVLKDALKNNKPSIINVNIDKLNIVKKIISLMPLNLVILLMSFSFFKEEFSDLSLYEMNLKQLFLLLVGQAQLLPVA